jgi:predicted neuraminidase
MMKKDAGVFAETELPVVLTNPGSMFRNEDRPGTMVLGMDRTPKGRIWGSWTGTGDKPDGYFLLATSDDGGQTWSPPRLAVGAVTGPGQRWSGALVGNLWTDPCGRLWLFFDQRMGDPKGRITNWHIRCDDPDALQPSWSEPVCFAEGCTLNKPTVLENGDWLLPVSDWHGKTARVYASTDEGGSWIERGGAQFPDWKFDEHMTVELRDGRLWMLARTSGGLWESFSRDQGATWSEPREAVTVRNLSSRFFLRRLRSGRILLIKNGSPGERLPQRSHMSAWLSEDDGDTWRGGLLLDERSAVSYPDGFESPDGLVHILYDWNRHSDAEILMAKFREQDILAGEILSGDAELKILVNKATGPKPEVLYNGITLPFSWPPPFRDPDSNDPMPLPYFAWPHRPRVVPIDVGRQFFVDDFLIEERTMERTFHQAQKVADNPVFKAETEQESVGFSHGDGGRHEATVYLGNGGVFYDPDEGLFKMFYVSGWRGTLNMAVSSDLLTWHRPEPGNSILDRCVDDNAMWLDTEATNLQERLKFLECHRGKLPEGVSKEGHYLYTSADGKGWSDGIRAGKAGDYCSFFFNPFRRKWCFSLKRNTDRGRVRYYLESSEFLQGIDWDRAVYWTGADRLDLPEPEGGYPGAGDTPQLYSLNAVAYESLMIGMHSIHRGPENRVCYVGQFPKLVDLELGFSRDGFHWDRGDRSGFIVGSRAEGAWDRGYLHSPAGVFVVSGDQLIFPYSAFSGVAPSGARGMYTGGSIGIATLRRDGFASMCAGGKEETLLTRPVSFSGKHLFVNVNNPDGALAVEVCSEQGEPLPGLTRSDCVPITADSTKTMVQWKERDTLGEYAKRPVRFKFYLTSGDLYAFWVSDSERGESGGYVAGGGPAFAGARDM